MAAIEQRASDLALLENSYLRNVYDQQGAQACEVAARTLLTATATIYAFVASPEQLSQLFDSIEASQSPTLLS